MAKKAKKRKSKVKKSKRAAARRPKTKTKRPAKKVVRKAKPAKAKKSVAKKAAPAKSKTYKILLMGASSGSKRRSMTIVLPCRCVPQTMAGPAP